MGCLALKLMACKVCIPVAARPHSANNGATDDVSKRARYALIGNAVSVPVAKWIGEQLMKPYL